MLKKNKGLMILTSVIILLPMLAGILLWDRLPEQMATHWGGNGEADGWSSRSFAVFVMPLILLALHWLCLWVTSKDPKNKSQSSKIFNLILWLVPALSLFSCGSIYAAALGQEFQINALMPAFLGLLFVIVGNYLPKTVQNRTIGIKIKWTLEDEANWNATHRLAGKLWVIGGLVLIVAAFLPGNWHIFVAPLLLGVMVLVPVAYSWWFHRKQKGETR